MEVYKKTQKIIAQAVLYAVLCLVSMAHAQQTPNTPPTVEIIHPVEGGTYKEFAYELFFFIASDLEDSDLDDSIVWSSNIDGVISKFSDLSAGQQTLTLSATDSGGLTSTTSVSFLVTESLTSTAAVNISSPLDGDTFYEGESISLDISVAVIVGTTIVESELTSNIDGILDEPINDIQNLSVGQHIITYTVTDNFGLPAFDSVSVNVIAANTPPTLEIVSPKNGDGFQQGALVGLAFIAEDKEDGSQLGNLTLSSSLDGIFNSISELTVGEHIITATVVDSGGLEGSDIFTIEIVPAVPPSIVIGLPQNKALFTLDENPVEFFAFSTFVPGQVETILWDTVAYSSSIDDDIPNPATLSVGNHVITVTATTSEGNTVSDSIDLIMIEPIVVLEPQVVFLSPADGDFIVQDPKLATEFQVGVLNMAGSVTLSFHSSLDGDIDNPAILSPGQHTLTVTASNNSSVSVSDIITINVITINASPALHDLSPTSGAIFTTLDNPITFDGKAFDDHDGDISEQIAFHSSIDGDLDRIVSLSVGEHVITASVEDSGGSETGLSYVIEVVERQTEIVMNVDFSDGLPGEEAGWEYYSSNEEFARLQVVDGVLTMDVASDNNFNLNEAIFTVDLSGVTNPTLHFFQSSHVDELHAMPETFVGHANADGVAISVDGETWYRVLSSSLLDVSSEGENFVANLEALKQTIRKSFDPEFSYSENTQIKFQQYDNYAYPNDARHWDDIRIEAEYTPLRVSQHTPVEIVLLESQIGEGGCERYTLANSGASTLDWEVQSRAGWLTVGSDGNERQLAGQLAPGEVNTTDICWSTDHFRVGDNRNTAVRFYDVSTGVSQTREIRIIVLADHAEPPYLETFSEGLPLVNNGVWQYYSSDETYGRIDVEYDQLRMAVSENDHFNLNEATLTIDLGQATQPILSFFQLALEEEVHEMPEIFQGHVNADGVAMSNDGVTWYRIVSAEQLDVSELGENYTVDLAEEVERIQSLYDPSFSLSESFGIKFQQYDNYAFPNDGRGWDNIAVTEK